MLPQSKTYLMEGGYSPRVASFMLIGLFLAGVVIIRGVSSIMHRFIPSHVVDCDHTHGDEEEQKEHEEMAEHTAKDVPSENHAPLLSRRSSNTPSYGSVRAANDHLTLDTNPKRPIGISRTISRTYTRLVKGQTESCDETGPCKGYSDPCGQDCFKVVQRRSASHPAHLPRYPTWTKGSKPVSFPSAVPEESIDVGTPSPRDSRSRTQSNPQSEDVPRSRSATHHYHHPEHDHGSDHTLSRSRRDTSTHSHKHSIQGQEHHHHVPTNAFMSIGLQTSIAIALHKAPEGFITYATNHANPTLGFAVFMALFIHNITEGFAMSLPLYLALNSRLKAIAWSSFLGGVSQPLGAGVAALWFNVAQRSGHGAPSESVYGGMFAVTAGVMTSVAVSLFSESLALSHRKGICIAFAFAGMGILGLSSALTAK